MSLGRKIPPQGAGPKPAATRGARADAAGAKVTPQKRPAQAKARKPRRRARGALATIGGLLIASALVRLASGTGEAVALEGSRLMTGAPVPAVAAAEPGPVQIQRVAESDLEALIETLDRREARVAEREEALAVRLQALDLAEREIEEKLVALERAEESLRQTMALAQSAAEDDLSRLTEVYATMKPKQAAVLFEEMDPQFAAGFLGRMRPDAAAQILAGMSPRAAYTVSVIVAGRNAEVPTE